MTEKSEFKLWYGRFEGKMSWRAWLAPEKSMNYEYTVYFSNGKTPYEAIKCLHEKLNKK